MTASPPRALPLDAIDTKLLTQLIQNSRQSLNKLAKACRTSKQTCQYRMRRLQEQGIITRYKARINASKLGYSTYTVYIRLMGLNEQDETTLIRSVTAHPFVRWLVTCTGRWDFIVSLHAKSNIEFHSRLSGLLSAMGDALLEYETAMILATNDLWLKDRYDVKNELVEASTGELVKMDQIDAKILAHLHEDARAELKTMASKTGLTPEAIAYRIKRLRAQGVIHSFTVGIDKEKLGLIWMQVQLLLNHLDDDMEKSIMAKLKSIEGISYVVTTSGAWNFEIHLYCKDFREFRSKLLLIRNLLGKNIRSYQTSIILSKYASRTLPSFVKDENHNT